MSNRPAVYLVLIATFLMILACSTVAPAAAPAPTADPGVAATIVAQGVEATQNAFTLQTLSAPKPQPTAVPPTAAPTEPPPTEAPPPTPEPQATEAPVPEAPTLEPAAPPADTQEMAMAAYVQRLYDTQQIRSSAGKYHAFPDVNVTWYDPKNYGFVGLNEAPKNLTKYVVRAKLNWRVPGNIEVPQRTGCGFAYGYSGLSNYHVSFLAVDSVVHTMRSRGSELIEMKGGPYRGGLGNTADVMLIVEDKMMSFYVNDVQVVTFRDPYMEAGRVVPAVVSGSAQGFTCKMTGVEMWILE